MSEAPSSVASRFVSQTSLDAAKAQREADWKAAYERLGQAPPEKKEDDEPYDGRSLWEKLKEQKDKKQDAFDEQLKFKNQFRALDEDEISFLDSLTEDNNEEEEKRQQQIKDELAGFRQAVASKSLIPPPASIPPLSGSTLASTSISPPLPAATKPKAPIPLKSNSKKKKVLPGVVLKKPAGSAGGSGLKRSASGSAGPAEKEDEGDTKKRKVEEGVEKAET